MGEVYRARDTTLDRDVAIKVLPDAFASDPDRLARFEREAKVLASLNHPNIGAIYGLEKSGDTRALVLELVEGPTLADRIKQGPIPLDEALPIAKQIADALEAAHEAGVIHRDLKPANVKVKADGTVKVLDFGLAKALDPSLTGDPSQSPTLTAAATQMGVIMGTAAYMSPEQAAGQTADKRSDIWSFGVVVYEMLTGQRLFTGDTVTHVLSAVLQVEPPWGDLPRRTPAMVRRLLRRCLEKRIKRRLGDIGEARFVIEESLTPESADEGTPVSSDRSHAWNRTAMATVSLLLLGAAAAGYFIGSARAGSESAAVATDTRTTRLTVDLSLDTPLAFVDARTGGGGVDISLLDLSPDGSTLVFVGESGGVSRLYVRRLDSFEVSPLQGTEGAVHPFFSPDGGSVGFLTTNQVKVVSVSGGAPRVLSDASVPMAATWLADGWIYFGDDEGTSLIRISVDGGTREELISEPGDTYGEVLPTGRHVLATRIVGSKAAEYADIRVVSLADGEAKTLVTSGYDPRYAASGHILFGRAGDLYAAPFDLDELALKGDPVRIASDVRMDGLFGYTQVAVSDSGVLAYAPGGDSALGRLAWLDRQGNAEFLSLEESLYGVVDLAPDGRRLAVEKLEVRDYILIHEPGLGETALRGSGHLHTPRWARTQNKIAYTTKAPDGRYQVLTQVPNSGRQADVMMEGEEVNYVDVDFWVPDDSRLLVSTWPHVRRFFAPRQGTDALPGGLEVASEYESFVDLNPSGQWVATYTGSGIEVRSLNGEQRYQVSAGYGTEPRWCRACDELFYRDGHRIFSVRVRADSDFRWEQPTLAFEVEGFIDTPGQSYDVSPDGQRLIVVKRERALPRDKIRVVSNWAAPF